MKQINVADNEAGQSLYKLLVKVLDAAPNSFIYKMLRKKNIKLNGKKADGSEKLVKGDVVEIFLADDTFDKFTKEKAEAVKLPALNLSILYKDEHVVIMNKPAGILSQKAEKEDVSMNDYLLDFVKKENPAVVDGITTFKPSICNRLDRNTSGILIGGISLLGLQQMAELLKERTIHKYYLCIVCGGIRESQLIEGYLKKDETNNKVTLSKTEVAESAFIKTEYTPLKATDEYTLLKVKLITGRSHQIRAHLASIGHPVIGDYKYGSRRINDKLKKEYNLQYQLLHSYELVFPELLAPLLGLSKQRITAPLPSQFNTIMRGLNLWLPGIPVD